MFKTKKCCFDSNLAIRSSAWGSLNQGLCVPFAGEDAFGNTRLKAEV